MGFFSKIKENLQHGGVKIVLQSPSSLAAGATTIPVTVVLTASQPQNITKVTVQLLAVAINRGNQYASNPSQRGYNESDQVLSAVDYSQPFSMTAGEVKTIPLEVIFDGNKPAVTGVLGGLQKLGNFLDSTAFYHQLSASANVEGIALDPSTTNNISLIGDSGGSGFSVKL